MAALETARSLTTLVSGKPLEWSARQAYRELLEWVVEDYEIDRPQAALLLAMVAHAGICQISNTDYTAYCVAPRDVLEPYALTSNARGRARRRGSRGRRRRRARPAGRRAGSRSRTRGSG